MNSGSLVLSWRKADASPSGILFNARFNEDGWTGLYVACDSTPSYLLRNNGDQAATGKSSFYSVNDPRLHFGLGRATHGDLDVRWPSGRKDRFE